MGCTQRCKRGDWLVNNQGDVYTVDSETFDRTYGLVSPGVYEKNAPVWAEQATKSGTIQTKEGATAYNAGDYLVFNNPIRPPRPVNRARQRQRLRPPCRDRTE